MTASQQNRRPDVRFVPEADIDRERKRSLTVLLYVPSEQKFELC
jgi:hypothetical protein